jgi:ribokinase
VSNEPVVLIAATGGDLFGRQLRSELARENLCMDHVFQVDEEATGVALILVDEDGENCISVAPGANARLDASHLDQVGEPTWQAAGVFLASLEVPLETVAEGLKRARAHGLTTILNPAPARGDLLEHPLMQELDLLTPNCHEAESMTGIAVVDLESAGRAGRQLQQRGPRQVIITRGAEGLVIIDDEIHSLPAIPVDVVDTTAAGDCFNGVLAAALAQQQDLLSAARQATMAAGICVTQPGAQPSLPTREELAGRDKASQETVKKTGQ